MRILMKIRWSVAILVLATGSFGAKAFFEGLAQLFNLSSSTFADFLRTSNWFSVESHRVSERLDGFRTGLVDRLGFIVEDRLELRRGEIAE